MQCSPLFLRRLLLSTLVFALLGCGGDSEPEELSGFVRTPLPQVGALVLPDVSHEGKPFQMKAADDELLIVYFGYTSCPDVCPTTLADVRKALEEIGSDAERVSVAMATVDPNRDTDDVLTSYVQTFVPQAHALRTENDASLRAVAEVFGVDYDITVDGDGKIDVMHTGSLYAIDDAGRIQVTWPFGIPAETLAADMRLLFEAA